MRPKGIKPGMNTRTKWWVAGVALGLTAVVAAGAVQVHRRNAQEAAERKGAKPALEFTQADIVRGMHRVAVAAPDEEEVEVA